MSTGVRSMFVNMAHTIATPTPRPMVEMSCSGKNISAAKQRHSVDPEPTMVWPAKRMASSTASRTGLPLEISSA